MNHLIVGDRDCSIGKILHAMHMSPTSAILDKKWRKLAIMLNTSTDLMNKLQRDLLLEKISVLDVLERILVKWRCMEGNAATFRRLLDILEHGCGCKSISYYLRNTMLQELAHAGRGVVVDIEEDRALLSESRHTNLQGPSYFRTMGICFNFRQTKKCALCTLVAVISFAVLLRLLYMLTS